MKPAEHFTYVHPHATVTVNPVSLQGIETGKIVTFSGASGAGKTTITEALHTPGKYHTVGKLTTREQRGTGTRERQVHPSVIEGAKRDGNFLYWMLYGGAEYLLPAIPVLNLLKENLTVLVDTPTIAALGLKRHLPDQVTTVFVDVPEPEQTLPIRMKARGDTDDSIKRRIADIPHVYASGREFDIVVLNPDEPIDRPLSALQKVSSLLDQL